MSRNAYCNTSYDLEKWLPSLHRMVINEELDGTDGIFPSGCSTFISSSAGWSTYGYEANDTLVVAENDNNEGMYHVNSVVSDNVLLLNRTAVTSSTGLTWQTTKMFNRMAQDASDEVDDRLMDLSPIITVPFNRIMYQGSYTALDDLDESIPLSLRGYTLNLQAEGSNFPAGITITGWGEWLDWRNAGVSTKFSTDDTKRPVTTAKTITESLTFTAAGTMTTTERYREIKSIGATYTGSGTLTVRLQTPRQISKLTALETVIQIVRGNYIQGTSNRSEWLEDLVEERERIYEDYATSARNLAELAENTIQRGTSQVITLQRG